MNLNTIISEITENGETSVDVYSKLSDDRILFIYDKIDDKLATDIVATLLLKNAENCEKKITIFINSEGGDIRDALMIYDMMCIVQSPIETICVGSAIDEAAIILSAGSENMRLATKNSLISINQLTNDWSESNDLFNAKKMLDQHVNDNKKMMEIFSKNTEKTLKQVMLDFNRRVFFNCNQALKYGLIDKIITFNK